MTVSRNVSNAIRTSVSLLALAACLAAGTVSAGTTSYKYDALGRVIEVTYPDGSKITYAYDSAGNRTAVTRTAGP